MFLISGQGRIVSDPCWFRGGVGFWCEWVDIVDVARATKFQLPLKIKFRTNSEGFLEFAVVALSG
jgi:hypothetical protein